MLLLEVHLATVDNVVSSPLAKQIPPYLQRNLA
jgi:hypothetical protein